MRTADYDTRTIGATQRNRWVIAWLLFVITIINYADRGVLGVVAPVLMKTFGLSIKQFGIIASGFGWGYVLMVFLGVVVFRDHAGGRCQWIRQLTGSAYSIWCKRGGGFPQRLAIDRQLVPRQRAWPGSLSDGGRHSAGLAARDSGGGLVDRVVWLAGSVYCAGRGRTDLGRIVQVIYQQSPDKSGV